MKIKIISLLMLISIFGKANNMSFNKSAEIVYKPLRDGKILKNGTSTILKFSNNSTKLYADLNYDSLIIGTPKTTTYVDFKTKQIFNTSELSNGDIFNYVTNLDSLKKLTITTETKTILGYKCKKATIVLFSNRIDIWYTTEAGVKGSPWQRAGVVEGLVLKVTRNGSSGLVAEKVNFIKNTTILPKTYGEKVTRTIYNQKVVSSYVKTINIFDNEQLCWGYEINNPKTDELNKTFHFAGGTVIVKKIKLPKNNDNYSIFAELTQYSNGDAYDRTGTIFIIPTEKEKTFLNALKNGIKELPVYLSDNQKYQGVVRTEKYDPLVELIRFYTSFGVRQFNKRRKIIGVKWANESYFKQDITDVKAKLKGEVWIGAFIGNYDKGGHKISLDLKYYPNSKKRQADDNSKQLVQPLFNTLNVMEMAGQNYGMMFKNDSLKVTFVVPEGVENLRIKYLSTGHGGWGGGDEFNPKENEIFIDGVKIFSHTPWRDDCGTFRKYNPSSGNFWNGVSSSDYSRSGWCPGTLTNPVFIYLKNLKPGKHTLQVAIDLGDPAGNSRSSWNVSGVLLGDYK